MKTLNLLIQTTYSKRADFKRQAKLYIIELYNQHLKPAGADSVQDSRSENNA